MGCDKVLFITTKNLDYLRNTQEIRLLKKNGYKVDVIGSGSESYPKRLLFVWRKLLYADMSQYAVIFVGFAPQLVVPFFRCKFKGKTLIIDFFISIYDTLIFDRKKWKEGGWIAKMLKKWDKVTILEADRVICDTKEHGKYFVREFGLNPEKLDTLYLEADRSIYHPIQKKRREEWKGDFLVLYFGSILPLQGVDIVLKSAEILTYQKKVHNIRFVMIGPIKEEKRVKSDRITYFEWLSQKELAEVIAQADLCLAGHFDGQIEKARRTIPGKAYIYRAMKKSMVLGDNPANHELYSEKEEGIYFVEMGNPDELAETIASIAEKKENTDEIDYTDTLL